MTLTIFCLSSWWKLKKEMRETKPLLWINCDLVFIFIICRSARFCPFACLFIVIVLKVGLNIIANGAILNTNILDRHLDRQIDYHIHRHIDRHLDRDLERHFGRHLHRHSKYRKFFSNQINHSYIIKMVFLIHFEWKQCFWQTIEFIAKSTERNWFSLVPLSLNLFVDYVFLFRVEKKNQNYK